MHTWRDGERGGEDGEGRMGRGGEDGEGVTVAAITYLGDSLMVSFWASALHSDVLPVPGGPGQWRGDMWLMMHDVVTRMYNHHVCLQCKTPHTHSPCSR